MTTLFLVRHGETVDNARKVMQGQTQGELNPTGLLQAREVARQMAGEPLHAIVASDLRRSLQTAEIIARPHRLPVVTTPLLRERDWGSFTGCYIPALKGRPWPDDIETLDHLVGRARSFLDFIARSYPDSRVLAVGHGIINKAIQAAHYDKAMGDITPMANAEVRVLTIS